MKTIGAIIVLAASLIFLEARSKTADYEETVPYPEDFRYWVHVRSGFIGPNSPLFERFGGIHHIYANSKAVQGLETGMYPDGAIFVADFLEMTINGASDEMVAEGSRRFVDVMYKDSNRFAQTGGWGFEEFLGNSRSKRTLDEQSRAECFGCHQNGQQEGLVFSIFRE